MDTTTILGLHKIIVTAFLLFFLIKTILLLANKTELLTSIRDKTKIIDMILGSLIIVSGVYLMMVTGNHSMWINIKALIALAIIPMGIIAMKKSNKLLSIAVIVLLIAAYGIGEAKPWIDKNKTETVEEASSEEEELQISDTVSQSILDQNTVALSTNAKAIYVEKCTLCHGEDGRKGTLGAADLTISTIGTQEKIDIITNGKGAMLPYKDELSKEEIESLAMYLTMLK